MQNSQHLVLIPALMLLCLAAACGQQAQRPLPDGPTPSGATCTTTPGADAHGFYYASQTLPPQTVRDKFSIATHDSFGPLAPLLPAIYAGVLLAANNTPEFHHGGLGYSRYLWHVAVDQTVENYMVEFIVPVATHEDTRYYVLGSGGFLHRTGYALSRVAVTRSDSGAKVFNLHEIVGAGAAAGVSTLYYPTQQRSFSNTAQQWGFFVGIDAATFVFREFLPEMRHAVFRDSHKASQP